ncbi:MAG: choline dehydrogenase [bacterium]|nr:choline dehydrogenase [bacterium]
MTVYDFVIVGGGSAGCALAARLSEDPSNRVLVLEAGRRDYRWDVFIHMPAALTYPIGSRFYDWQYESEPEPHMGGRRIYHARGKVLGGSSSINGMIFQRGNPMDYEKWAAAPGMDKWDYAHCLPYFKRLETTLAGTDRYRGGSGPLILERGPADNPLFRAFFEAGEQAGIQRTPDVNGYRQEGFAAFDANRHRGRRLSAARAYLHPIIRRPNLRVVTGTHVTRILFAGNRATGAEYRKSRAIHRVAAREVIVCGGAINTPQLLMLSGLGPSSHLERFGIDVVEDLPGVGQNLQDHLEVYVQYASKLPVSLQSQLAWWRKPMIGLQWLFRRGPGTSNHFEAGGFVRSNPEVAYPNLMLHFLPIAIRYDGSVPAGGHGYQVHVGPMYSNSRGRLFLKSPDPFDKPGLQFNYLSTPADREEWVEAVRFVRHVLNQPAFERFNGGELSPGPDIRTDGEIIAWVARDAETALHPCGTARMGADSRSVVAPDSLRVHGVTGLRVVDASVMPTITNGNIYAPVMMIAERAADMILGKEHLPPDYVDWYRHSR